MPTAPGGLPTRRIGAGLAVALLALSGLATGTTATAAGHRAAAPSGDYCAAKESFYGSGQYTYAEAQVCLRFGSGGNEVRVNNTNSQYYWGGSWYSASSSYPANWTASGTLSKSGQSGNYSVPQVKQTSLNGSGSGGSPAALNGCGSYSVTMTFRQVGPYWGQDQAIDSGQRTYTINVPCT
ncbi:hypothetical protein [Streptomyces sp. ISL-11]|uniref:hypothetical protein n=1 Tax=Streptomyces sp. ISL-11 TaxID=2819174 RepID=UPI001BE76A68|nr:hypothetical protein [Streptomyces sp. ISL-11]MBT2382432.1 hypothetical protein [Streptomyces sp. ISL-11]